MGSIFIGFNTLETGMLYMIWVIINSCIFGKGTDTDIKQIENSKETPEVYGELFDMYSVSYYTIINAIFEFLICRLQLCVIEIRFRNTRKACGVSDWFTWACICHLQ
jgi:hypothetical protein